MNFMKCRQCEIWMNDGQCARCGHPNGYLGNTNEAMTHEEMRLAIAEAAGWTHIAVRKFQTSILTGVPSENANGLLYEVPDYPGDLNAMHEAEKVVEAIMHERGDDYAYGDKLVEVTQNVRPISATAAQRAEAFCRTIYPERFRP